MHTRLTANATIGVKIYNTIFSLIQCFCGADADTRRIITMIAAIDQEIAARIGELPAFDVLDPGAVDTDGDIMFSLTRNGASMTSDTLALVDNKCVLGHWLPFSR
ncbi:MAG: hypothetical protein NVSMB49_01800 [Ktedonobacteraceae bacterium]